MNRKHHLRTDDVRGNSQTLFPMGYLVSVAEDMSTVLAAATHFNTGPTPEMEARQRAVRSIAAALTEWMPSSADYPWRLEVRAGGRQSNFAPVPWVRIFSPAHSPKTTEGYYLVYLFSGDGAHMYLSLNQGTSEFRSGDMRPILDERVIQERAAAARALFTTWDNELVGKLEPTIALHVGSMPVGTESKKRARNYEVGNVYAIRYESGAIPPDVGLRADLDRMMLLLSRVYESAEESQAGLLVPGSGNSLLPAPAGEGQRRVQDSKIRRAIEDYSMEFAASHYPEPEWSVEDVSRYRPYDLLCRHEANGLELHVEVKGTSSTGSQVFLTREEVKHAKAFDSSVLAIVHGIHVSATDDGVVCSGGELHLIDPWTPSDEDLEVVQYAYRVTDAGTP